MERVDASTQKYAAYLINSAIFARASDIHLEPLSHTFRVRYRIDGYLQTIESLPKDTESSLLAHLKLLSGMNISERRLPQDGRFDWRYKDFSYDIRSATYPTIQGESLVLRLLNKKQYELSFSELGFLDDHVHVLKSLIEKPEGILLFTGPTGSGKSTTLYSILHHLKHANKKIITLEDPVEYKVSQIHQVRIQDPIGLSFANGLRAILRQAPDIILVGEIRDTETLKIAIHAAITGHKVLSTLHTYDTARALLRLLEMGIPYYLISGALQGVVAQRLIRKICPFCVSDTVYDNIYKDFLEEDVVVYSKRGLGCEHCLQTGFLGRLGVFEILPFSPNLADLLSLDFSLNALVGFLKKEGIRTLKQDAVFKAQRGLTSWKEILKIML